MSETASNHIQARIEAGVLQLTFNRPEKKNAFTGAMYTRAAEALEAAATDAAVRAVLLQGSGGAFSAGNDLGDFLENPPSGEDSPVFRYLRALVFLDKPVVAAVDGVAVGIGTTMLLHCDYVVASERTRFALPFVNLGLVPEAASSLLLPQVAGSLLAAELLMFGEPFDAATALRAGLVNRVLAPDAVAAHAAERAAALAQKPAEALQITKRLLRAPQREAVEATLRREGAEFVQRLVSDEAREAFMAFMARKK